MLAVIDYPPDLNLTVFHPAADRRSRSSLPGTGALKGIATMADVRLETPDSGLMPGSWIFNPDLILRLFRQRRSNQELCVLQSRSRLRNQMLF